VSGEIEYPNHVVFPNQRNFFTQNSNNFLKETNFDFCAILRLRAAPLPAAEADARRHGRLENPPVYISLPLPFSAPKIVGCSRSVWWQLAAVDRWGGGTRIFFDFFVGRNLRCAEAEMMSLKSITQKQFIVLL